ncbi:hypothetical protein [Acidicapsa ligni]|uniref:hypothetical protein n=1 Tax=Acidicapsa ligni TaxID=542300 RepID=UPI0021DF8825|nr:hypothetical protein [Acidicapsa ligni]
MDEGILTETDVEITGVEIANPSAPEPVLRVSARACKSGQMLTEEEIEAAEEEALAWSRKSNCC